ncbi:PREDICTED: gametogenetin-binding protein 1-like [Chrysochloris asiatica]|uniref:Gametogenetin-binding protein 1 n=1 Tax=Chrysochloris asiatica TaxID=185453 RepID=A0A9B0T8T6_CHRAS|nr:PREDICTED: gametogenetin-binding protein 1-like [Chrysochloris asiatica]
MEVPAPTQRSQILGCSSMFRFFRNLVGSKSSQKCTDKGGQASPSQEQHTVPLRVGHQGPVERRESRLPSTLVGTLAMVTMKGSPNLPRNNQDHSCLGMGDTWAQNLSPTEMLRELAQGKEVKSVLPRGSQAVLGSQSEKEEEEGEEKKETARRASSAKGAWGRGHFAQALEMEQERLQKAVGPLQVSPKILTREPEKEYLLDGYLKVASSKAGMTPWNHLLSLYKQLQKSAMAKFPLKEGLPREKEKGEEEEVEEEDSLFNLCVPGIVILQSPLHRIFRSTDTVGFVESELKKLLAVQRESRLWKMGSTQGRELLAQPEITLEAAGIVDGQHLLLEEMDEMGNWPPE